MLLETYFGISLSIASSQYDLFPICFLGAILISISLLEISAALEKSTQFLLLKNMLLFWGMNSLLVMCVHDIELSLFPWEGFIELFERIFNYEFQHHLLLIFILKIIFIWIFVLLYRKAESILHFYVRKEKDTT